MSARRIHVLGSQPTLPGKRGLERLLPYMTQLGAEAGAFLRNLLLARLAGAEAVGLAASFALVLRLAEMAGALGLDRQLARLLGQVGARLRGRVRARGVAGAVSRRRIS